MVRQLKEAKTYQEQIENLINNHALQISDRTKAEEILSTVNYYRLSAYGIGLMQPADPEKYLPGITLEHIYHLYQFDSGLRNILTPLIEYVEIAFRTRLAYQLAITYGAEGYRDHILQEDLLFSSPSYAAMFVIGKSANGLTSWKTADGKTLKSLESEQPAD